MEICTIGGFEEVGKNMTAVKVGEDVFLFDAGLHLPSVIELQENEDQRKPKLERDYRRVGAIPNDLILDKIGWRDKVLAISISHAHLDHVGGVPYIANRYPNAKILGSPFTINLLKSILTDDKIRLRNRLIAVKPNSVYTINGKNEKYKIEFVHTTHSTIQCTFPVLHTKEGSFFYGLDLKFDNYPTMGNPPNYDRIKEIGKKGVKLAVVDALYSRTEKKPGGEKVARHLLEEAFSKVKSKKAALFVTTFSSHIERLKNIVEFGRKINRQIIFLGRSLNKYVNVAIEVGLCPFRKNVTLVKYRSQINSVLKKIEKERGKYLVVCTGHQAEKGSILDRIVKGETPFKFRQEDNLIFSSSTIPTEPNITSREKMDMKLRKMGVKLQTDVHVHGHGSREDLRDFLEMVKPEHLIPSHGSIQMISPMIDLAKEYGYKIGKNSHLVYDGSVLKI
jgi:ribonuclease J